MKKFEGKTHHDSKEPKESKAQFSKQKKFDVSISNKKHQSELEVLHSEQKGTKKSWEYIKSNLKEISDDISIDIESNIKGIRQDMEILMNDNSSDSDDYRSIFAFRKKTIDNYLELLNRAKQEIASANPNEINKGISELRSNTEIQISYMKAFSNLLETLSKLGSKPYVESQKFTIQEKLSINEESISTYRQQLKDILKESINYDEVD